MLDGLGTTSQYPVIAKKRGVDWLAITDHGSLAGVYEWYMNCLKNGIEPILGEEFYFLPNMTATEAKQFKDTERNHITVLAIDEQGYRILKELHDESHRNFYYKPLVDRHMMEQLGDAAEHLYVLSGCAGSVLSHKALHEGLGAARDELEWWLKVFPNFAIELQFHGTDDDPKIVQRLLKLSRLYDLPIVATNDCHYVSRKDAATHDALLAIQTAADIDDPDRFRFDGSGYHLRTRAELRRAFGQHLTNDEWKAAANNSIEIARSCRTRIPAWDQRTWHIPKLPGVVDAQRELVSLVRSGLRERGLDSEDAYVLRAKHELREIKKVGIAHFMLMCREQMVWARGSGIRVGRGRGSVAGCLVGFLVGIHTVDSVRGKLPFERFINPERPKMPDIDSDFQPSRREEVFVHLQDVYGKENTMRVAAYQTMKVAGAFRKLAAAHGIPWMDINRISKQLNPVGGHPDDAEGEEDDDDWSVLPEEIAEAYPDLHQQIVEIIGTKSAISQHAAGMLIFDPEDPVKELIPYQWITDKPKRPGFLAGAFDLNSTEKIGLMKMDELGLNRLDTIQYCVSLLAERGIELEPDDWIPDEEPGDSDVYRMLAEGKVAGVFQMEGGTNARGIIEIRPTCFEDIVACTALYRAGPLGVGADKRYIKNKRSGRVRVVHPSLRSILKDTWGEMIYQEQMMDICHNIAGFSWTETDDVKETVRFKDPIRMKTFKDRFVSGCVNYGVPLDSATQIWAMIESQSTYLFNRCHAYAYSLTTYETARLKFFYPLEYMTAYLATVPPENDGAKERRARIMAEAYERGFQIAPPDIHLSGARMTCENGDTPTMRFGFVDIKGIGDATAEKIVNLRGEGFQSLQNVTTVGKRALDALSGCGALESLGGPRRILKQTSQYVDWQFTDRMAKYRARYRDQCKLPSASSREGTYCAIIGEVEKFEKRTTKSNKPFRVLTLKWSPAERFTITLWQETSDKWPDLTLGSIVAVEGKWSREWSNISIGNSEDINILIRRGD